jgi:transcription termination factor NusB
LDYIRYHEAEQLFIAWPLLEAILESKKVDLLMARSKSRSKEDLATDADYIEGLVFGSDKSLDSAPPTGKISDSTGNIAANYRKVMSQDRKSFSDEWREFAEEVGEEYFVIAPVLDKLKIAFKNLTVLQQNILKLYYWENKVWKEVSKEVAAKSVSAIKAERDRALNKMAVILKNSMDYATYQKIMEMVETKKEGPM